MVDAVDTWAALSAEFGRIFADCASRGQDLANDSRLAEAVLLDSLPDNPAEIQALVEAIKVGAVQMLLDQRGTPSEFLISSSATQLAAATGLRDDLARWATESWWSALSLGASQPPGTRPDDAGVAGAPGPSTFALRQPDTGSGSAATMTFVRGGEGAHRNAEPVSPFGSSTPAGPGYTEVSESPPPEPTDVPTNLTRPMSSFVGRDAEVADVIKLLTTNRVVTLVGAGGAGKTRLAVEVGRTLLTDTSDGVWLVELATVSDSALVAPVVLGALGIGAQSGNDALATVVSVLASQNRVIILDNCEQVIDGCAVLADAVARNCIAVTLLSTSREPLRIDGEVVYRVPSLSLPPEHVEDRGDLAGSGAVALFVERATAQVPGFQLSDEEAVLVASICRRLDGMPLALELATSRLRSMSLAQLHDRLELPFSLLTAGSRVALPRQQTLRALVDWSYELLSESEQALFRRATVFVGGFELEAAEAVCPLDDIPRWEIVSLLGSLVDKSLVVAEPHGSSRYRLQETLRRYGSDLLAEGGAGDEHPSEAERVEAAHRDYYLGLAEEIARHLDGRAARAWLRRLDTEELNLRAAIAHSLATVDGADRVLHQFWLLHRYWTDSSQPAQTLALLEQALARAGEEITTARRSQALLCKAFLLANVDARLELDAVLAALRLAREAGDKSLEAAALSLSSRCLAINGRLAESLEAGAAAVALARQLEDPVRLGEVRLSYAVILEDVDAPGAETAYLEALASVEHSGDELTALKAHTNYALFALGTGNLADARRHLSAALDLSGPELTIRYEVVRCNLGWLLLREGHPRRAASCFADVLRRARLNGIAWLIPYAALGLACCTTHRDGAESAAVLHGGADALLSASADQWDPLEEKIRGEDIAVLRERLGGEFEHHYGVGLAMPHEQIVKLALAHH